MTFPTEDTLALVAILVAVALLLVASDRTSIPYPILLVIGGLVLGMAGAALATRALRTMLFGVSTLDAVTFVGAAFALGGVAMLATYVPARRAARIDPMEALRSE